MDSERESKESMLSAHLDEDDDDDDNDFTVFQVLHSLPFSAMFEILIWALLQNLFRLILLSLSVLLDLLCYWHEKRNWLVELNFLYRLFTFNMEKA